MGSTRTILSAGCAAAVALLTAGCGAGMDPAVAATVNGADVPVEVLDGEWARVERDPQFSQQLRDDPSGRYRALVRGTLLSSLIKTELVAQAAQRLGVQPGPEDLRRQREAAYDDLGGQRMFERAREQAGYSADDIEEAFVDAALLQAVVDEVAGEPEITRAQIEQRYEQEKATRYGPSVTARHILTDEEAQARAVLDRLAAGEDFAALAAEVSTDTPSAEHGGELGEITRGETTAAFEAAAFGAQVGQIVGPVRSELGFHLIQVTARRDEPRPLDEVADEIRDDLAATAGTEVFDRFLADEARRAEVVVNPAIGTWNPEAGAVVPTGIEGLRQEAQEAEEPMLPGAQEPTVPGAQDPSLTEETTP